MAEPLASMPRSDAVILFAYYSLLILIALVLAIQIWPDAAKLKDEDSLVTFGWYKATIRRESRLVLTVAVMGFLGGTSHYFWLLTHWAALGDLKAAQVMIYLAKPWIAAAIAVIAYALLRGGIATGIDASKDLNAFGMAGFGGLVGLFANEVIEKLNRTFQ